MEFLLGGKGAGNLRKREVKGERGGKGGHTVDGSLTTELLEHFRRSGQPITRFSDGNVEDEFVDAEFPHGVLGFVFAFRLHMCHRK